MTASIGPLARRFKPYPAYKDSGVEWLGGIPVSWEVKRLSWLTECLDGRRVPLNAEERGRMQGEYPYWGANSIVDHVDRWIFDEELVLLGEDGAPFFDPLRSVAFRVSSKIWVNNHAHVLRPRRDVDATFLAQALNCVDYRAFIDGTTRDKLTQGDMNAIPIQCPPFSEQRAIADFLHRETARIDALVAKKERLIELLEEKRAALITRAVTKGLDPSVEASEGGSEVFPLIGAGWELRKLRHLITQVKRPIQVDLEAEYQEIGIRSWGRGIFHKEPIKGALLEDKSVYRIEPGDFVLNIVFAWEGAAAVASEAERGMVGSHRFPTFRVSDDVDVDYLLMVLQTEQGRWLMEVNSPGAAGRNKTIRLNQFLDEAIPLPSLLTQQEIVRRYRSEEQRLDALVRRLGEGCAALAELRTALISAAVTGKIDVRNAAAG